MSNLIVHHVLGWLWSKNYPTPGFTLKNGYFLYMFHSSKSRTHFLGLCCTAGNLRLIQDMPQKNQSHNMSQASHAVSWEEILPNTDNLQNRTQFSSGFVKKNKAWNHESTKALDTALLMLRDVAGTHQTISKTATHQNPTWIEACFVSSPMISGKNNLCMFRLLNEVAVCWFQVSGIAKWLQNHSHFLSTHIIHRYRRLTILSGVLPTQTQHLRKKNSPFGPAQPRLLGKRTFLKTWRHCKGLLEPLLLITNIPEKPTKYNPTVNERFDKYV